MDGCPNCGARLTGEPSWCPRCLARFDQRAVPARSAVRTGATAFGAPSSTVSAPPTMYTPPVARPPLHEPTPSWEAPAPDTGKNPIPRTVVKAILLGVVLQAAVYGLTRGLKMEPAPAVALGLGLTLAFYLLVLSMVHGRLFDSAVKPVWHIGPPGTGLVIGVGVGGLLAFVVVAATSALTGRVSSDASATIAFAQGGFVRAAVLITIMVVAAPVVEELLFRGLLAESLRGRGKGAAIWLSALAFALWHLRPDAIRYYLLCGALLGLLYWKRGLVCSMAAHATFNGLLVLVAALSLAGPARTVNGDGVSMSVPASWRQVTSTAPAAALELRNPSGAAVFVHRLPPMPNVDAGSVVERMSSLTSLGADMTVKTPTAHAVQYPAGAGAEVDIIDHGRAAEAVFLSTPTSMVAVELVTGGNANARADFEKMLQSLAVS